MVTFGVMMPELNLILMDVLVIEGKADVTGDFVCECLDDLGGSHECVAADFGTVEFPGPYFESAAICDYTFP